MRFLILIFFLLLSNVILSQKTLRARKIFKVTDFCFSENNTNIQSILNIDGYYLINKPYMNSSGYPTVIRLDTAEMICVFYSDGLFSFHFEPENFKTISVDKNGVYEPSRLQWGRYLISNDTIKGLFSENPGGMFLSYGQIWFKIINKNTIRVIGYKNGFIDNTDLASYQLEGFYYNNLGQFIPYNDIPDANKSWLKHQKWFWCDKTKFEKWKLKKHL